MLRLDEEHNVLISAPTKYASRAPTANNGDKASVGLSLSPSSSECCASTSYATPIRQSCRGYMFFTWRKLSEQIHQASCFLIFNKRHPRNRLRIMAPRYSSVAVIGAGPSGISAVKALSEEDVFERIQLFDRREGIGGTWYVIYIIKCLNSI